MLFDGNPAPMWVYDLETLRFLAVNDTAVAQYGYTRDEFLAMTIEDIRPPEDVPQLLDEITRVARGERSQETLWRHRRKDGGLLHVEIKGSACMFGGRRAQLILVRDVSKERELIQTVQDREEALTRLALHDPLTGLSNRALLMDRLGQALDRQQRSGGLVAVLFIDLDRFKAVNDSLGHATGDQLLVAVASRLRHVLRPTDTVARLGGDEFAVVCDHLEDEADVADIAERLRRALVAPVTIDGQDVKTSASIGVALARSPGASPEDLLRDADTAMYQAKGGGRNRFEIFEPGMRARSVARRGLAEELRLALERNELRVFYQPEVDLTDESVTGMEALVRWQHPSRGLLAPSEFIQVAEETGLVVPLGEWVLREACQEMARRSGAPGQEGARVSVNLSARQLGQAGLVDTVRNVLRQTGLAPTRLCLEITESGLMDDVEHALGALVDLKALGIHLAIDDFGTGYSSLSYLRRFPVDVVKLDRSFVAGLGADPAATAIVAAALNLSHALGFGVVAEGVETKEQLVTLRALRCDRAQGYFWSRPVPPAELPAFPLARPAASLTAAPVDVASLLAERATALRTATGRTVVLQVPVTLAPAFGEAGAVKSVVDQLLANAVKYSDPDRPVVVSAAADKRWVRVSVADFGRGMTPDEAARCFEQFWQSKPADGGRRQGIGIGLYIVRSLVDAMGGHVAVKTAPGRGSTFTVALPRSARAVPVGSDHRGIGEDSSIREFMRQIGVSTRRKP
ncbi:MAG TPA: EAL domain-containing protein [Acidimicrobiia bacterium]